MKLFWLILAAAAVLPALDVSTGAMLGAGYDPRAFYVREPGGSWRKTYSDTRFRPEAQGKLMNLRLAQALFHDEWLTEQPFDPARNTGNVIEALDFYRRHGVLMINVSLQCGQAGYDKKVNGVDRRNGYRFGREQGTHTSAFRPDGTLKPEWLDRLAKLIREAGRRGMIVNLMYFYQGQDELFASTDAIHTATRNATAWLAENKFRNVMLDIANEFDLPNGWDFDRYIPNHIGKLVEEARSRFPAGARVPVGASTDGKMRYPESLIPAVDYVLIHGNNRAPGEKVQRLAAFANVAKPVLMNEDDNGRASTSANFAKEADSCDLLFRGAAGWGYMPWVQAQRFPFRFMPAASANLKDDLPEMERDMVYFHAVLDHIAKLTLKQLPD